MMIEQEATIDEVLNIDTSELLDVNIGDQEEQMTLYTMSRWLSLINGIEVINEKAHQLKIDLSKDKSWVKPLALQKFIDEQTPSFIAQVKTLTSEE